MKVRVLRQSLGHVDGVSLRYYHPGSVYEVPPNVANYLVAEGLARFEMRNDDHPMPPPDVGERRRSGSEASSGQQDF